jgi:capsular exopolysaccharide synthesis family protein
MYVEKKSVMALRILLKHKKKILFSILFFTFIASIFSYLKPNMYQAKATVEIGLNNIPQIARDSLETAISPSQTNLSTEIEIIKSRSLIVQALERVDVNHRYYMTSGLREQEMYGNSPFEVELTNGENLSFSVTPIKRQFYRLEVNGVDRKTLEPWAINKIYPYGKDVKEKYFSFTLFLKDSETLQKDVSYRFEVLDTRRTIDIVKENLQVKKSMENSTILHILYVDNIPLRAKEFTNVLTQVYLEKGVEKKTLESTLILDFIDKQLANIDTKLMNSEKNLETFKQTSNIDNDSVQGSNFIAKGENYKEQLQVLTEEETMLSILHDKLSKGKNFSDISTVGLNLSSTSIPRLLTQLQDNLFKRRQLRVAYTMAHPKVRQLTQAINHSKESIIKTLTTLKTHISKRKNLLLKTIKEYDKLMEALPAKEKVLGGLKRKFIVNEKIYSYVMEKRAATAIAKASVVNKNSIMDSAVIPLNHFAPNRLWEGLWGALLGLIIGLVLVFISEYLDDRIKDEEDIRKRSTLTLLGTIPHIDKESASIKVFEAPKSVVTESFRALRTNLQFMHDTKEATLISITSTIGGEGKSTISTNLAAILSLTGKNVIVLNLDMRKPTLHKKFSLPNTKGMSNLLSGHEPLKDVIQKTKYRGIYIISSGPIPPNPSELIEHDNMKKVITALKLKFDIIIFDTPPIGLVTDAMTLMKMSDITLFVLRANHSKKAFLTDINRIKEEHKIQGLSLLLNGVKTFKNGYGYYEEG